ncbi:hypothetical protein BOTBODRAFT_185140 [Botryobasidium botryosum FD-172 SS1]|uniref:Uncharacterized protein n=1 Tax=Botryobasidium botryosum (strain FD-172 SS1) TaxID=930990 RepID=A0A067MSI8_BOTB1|nr:hypothetical protein BOTBODRAFT_185140 [Botryobasidium botryosum FD-172 SS1]
MARFISYMHEGSPGLSLRNPEGIAALNGGNHTHGSALSAQTDKAHDAPFAVTKALALTGLRVVTNAIFLARVKSAYVASLPTAAKN